MMMMMMVMVMAMMTSMMMMVWSFRTKCRSRQPDLVLSLPLVQLPHHQILGHYWSLSLILDFLILIPLYLSLSLILLWNTIVGLEENEEAHKCISFGNLISQKQHFVLKQSWKIFGIIWHLVVTAQGEPMGSQPDKKQSQQSVQNSDRHLRNKVGIVNSRLYIIKDICHRRVRTPHLRIDWTTTQLQKD